MSTWQTDCIVDTHMTNIIKNNNYLLLKNPSQPFKKKKNPPPKKIMNLNN